MKNFLRNCIPLLLLAALSLSAAALRPGDVAGQVLATEIRAFIDGVEIPAYNIDGNLGVVAEDLNAYGFVTGYDDPTRTLTVARTGAAVRGVRGCAGAPAVGRAGRGPCARGRFYPEDGSGWRHAFHLFPILIS